jgi:4'-phosphopantetheinyl transferase
MKINRKQVEVWLADLSRFDPEELLKVLSRDEIERAGKLKFEKRRNEFIVARGILRAILSKYLEKKPEEIAFSYEESGKPRIEKSRVCFNLSHSGNTAIYAIALDLAVGVDIEKVGDIDFRKIAEDYFSREEAEDIMKLPPGMQKEAFYRAWTRKEAVVKAKGGRLSKEIGKRQEEGDWLVREVEFNGCIGAVTVRNRNAVIRTKQYKAD